MLRVFVDSGSSIKQEEKSKYDIEIIPLRYLMGEKEYEDGLDQSIEEFYEMLITNKLFPKTSLPYLDKLEKKVSEYTKSGDEVIILVFSSKLSSTFDSIKALFEDNPKVKVIDTMVAVGGIRILVEEINKYRDQPLDVIVDKIENLIPRIKILAIPETLNYLLKGGRLSIKDWILGTSFHIKPVITFKDGYVKVECKKIGLKNAAKYIAAELDKTIDPSYPIIASYTYKDKNLKLLLNLVDQKYLPLMSDFDNIDPVIACHWGPNACGFIFVTK